LRVAFVTETWLPSTDGIVTRLLATCRELLDAGHDVLVVCPRPGMPATGQSADSPQVPSQVRVCTVPTVGAAFLYGGQRWGLPVPAVGRYLRQFGPDVVHVVNPVFLGIAGVASARRSRLPLVESYHTNVATYAGYYHLGWLRPLIWFVLRTLHSRATINLATSRTGQRELAAHHVAGTQLWPRGVDLDLFRPASATPEGRPVALYVGRLAAEKGLGRLAVLSAPDSDFDLLIVGDGPYREELREVLGPSARFTGTLHGEALADAYRSANVFVFPSTTDTLGLVVLEALASGLPVVAVQSPSSEELLTGCPAAKLVSASDPQEMVEAARELVAFGLTAATQGVPDVTASARQFSQTFGWRDATSGLLDHYARAIQDNAGDLATSRRRPRRHRPRPARR